MRAGHVLTGLGIACMVWAVLYMNVRAIGGPPKELKFANRRPYSTVKTEVHAAFPGFLVRALTGLGLVLVGRRVSRSPA